MKREVRLYDLNRGLAFHAIEIGPDEWFWTEPGRAGIGQFNRQFLISHVDDKIGTLQYGSIEVTPPPGGSWFPGNFGEENRNLWIDGEYLAPHEYLVKLIPRQEPESDA